MTIHRYLKEGAGWRLGWRPEAAHYQGLVGGDGWAVEMTAPEFQDFCRLAQQLAETMQQAAPELMDAERITCEAETPLIWLEVEGFPNDFSLRFILLSGRGCEGGWPAQTVSELLQTLPTIALF